MENVLSVISLDLQILGDYMKEISKEMAIHKLMQSKNGESLDDVYLLYPDGTESLACSVERIKDHDFIFGFEEG